jgi:hypothetical protein
MVLSFKIEREKNLNIQSVPVQPEGRLVPVGLSVYYFLEGTVLSELAPEKMVLFYFTQREGVIHERKFNCRKTKKRDNQSKDRS